MKITQHCGRRGIRWSEDSPGLAMERAIRDRDPFQPDAGRDAACGAVRTPAEVAEMLRPFAGVVEARIEPCVIDGTVC